MAGKAGLERSRRSRAHPPRLPPFSSRSINQCPSARSGRPPPRGIVISSRRRTPLPVSGHDTLQVRRSLQVGDLSYDYFSIPEAGNALGDVSRLPFSLKVLLENLLRF